MKKKKEKKIIWWAISANIIVGILSVPIIRMGLGLGLWNRLIILAFIFALFGIVYWAMGVITDD